MAEGPLIADAIDRPSGPDDAASVEGSFWDKASIDRQRRKTTRRGMMSEAAVGVHAPSQRFSPDDRALVEDAGVARKPAARTSLYDGLNVDDA